MLEGRQGPRGDLESISDWSGKLQGAALRIAGNFHLVEHGASPPQQIETQTIERALDLATLLIDHARAAFDLMNADTSTGEAKAIYQWIIEGRLEQFSRGEVYRHFKGRFTGKTDRLDNALNDLKTRAVIKQKKERTSGRHATVFDVNPQVLVTL
jgi:putative DNA primase/helicase